MCVRVCDCDNCKRIKTCVGCTHIPNELEVPCFKCNTVGVQDCPFRIKFDKINA